MRTLDCARRFSRFHIAPGGGGGSRCLAALPVVLGCYLGGCYLVGCSSPSGTGEEIVNPSASATHAVSAGGDDTAPSATEENPAGGGTQVVSPPAESEQPVIDQAETDGGGVGESCGRDTYKAESVGVNLYLLVDVSGSMRFPIAITDDVLMTRWDAVRGAIKDFIGSSSSDGLELALSYYPIHTERATCSTRAPQCAGNVDCVTAVCDISLGILGLTQPCVPQNNIDTDDCIQDIPLEDGTVVRESCVAPGSCVADATRPCFLDENCEVGDTCGTRAARICPGITSCDSGDYSNPAVARSALPSGAAPMLLSLDATEPDSFSLTPTHIALRGAYESVSTWIADQPDRRSVVVLATDGDPTGCIEADAQGNPIAELDDTVSVITDAQMGGIETFVIGVLDPEITDLPPGQVDYVAEARHKLTLLAEAGGAEEPSFVTSDDSTATSFLAALDRIRGVLVPCEFKIPETQGEAVFGKLNVEVTQGGQNTVTPKVPSDTQCGTMGGWYYDTDVAGSTGDPSRVILCPSSCDAVRGTTDVQVDIVIGCKTVVAQMF